MDCSNCFNYDWGTNLTNSSFRNLPIAIFDSGVGGLTVAHAIAELLPQEDLIYVGDTVHLPYGDKSPVVIQGYVLNIVNFLIAQRVKLIVIACNSAAAASFSLLKERLAGRVEIISVIEPMVEFVKQRYTQRKVGLIGTQLTVNSQIYARYLQQVALDFVAVATPLLVPLIEAGESDSPVLRQVLFRYLAAPQLSDLSALILGCTHYPLIKPALNEYYQGTVDLLDSSEVTAQAVKARLVALNALRSAEQKSGTRKFYLSDLTSNFVRQAQQFFAVGLENFAPLAN